MNGSLKPEGRVGRPAQGGLWLGGEDSVTEFQQELATKEVEQWVRSELESTDLWEKFDILGKTTKEEDKQETRKPRKLNNISGKIFGLTKEGTKIMSIFSVAGHQVVKNLSEPSEITLVHLDVYADYLREKDPKLDSRAVRALLTTGGPRLMRVDGHYIEVHVPYRILMNVDGIFIYTKAHVIYASDQIGRIYIGQEELKVRRIGHNAMLEQDAVHMTFDILGKTTKEEDKQETRKPRKLNNISGKIFGLTKEGTKIMSIFSVAGHQVVKNLSEPSEITPVHLDVYADYLREKDPKLDSRAVRALLTTGGPRLMRVDGHYIEVHVPYPILMNVDGIIIYTKAHVIYASDQIGRIYIGQEELKVRRIGHNAMLEQDAVAKLDVQGRQLSVKGLLDTGAVVSVMPVSTWTDMGFDRLDLIPTNIRLVAANQGAIYVTGRTPIISLQLGGRHIWMSFLVVENLDESEQFILGRDFVRNFDVTIDLNDRLIRIKDPERKYEKKPLNKILINQPKLPIFLDRKVKLKPNPAVVAKFRLWNLNELSNDRQVCLVPNPNSKSSAILGRSFSLTQSRLCASVLLNTEATSVTIQRGKKHGYALPLNTDFQTVENLKKFDVTRCPSHANQECILKRINELKSSKKLFSMQSETDDGLSSCSNFPERSTETEFLSWPR